MTDLEDFEAEMIRLLMVWLRFMTVHKEYPKITETGIHGNHVRNIYREYTVINLVSFIKVRRDLVKHEDFRKLDDVIKPLVEPILKHEDAIFQLRNQYLAHVQEDGRKFEVLISDIVQKHNFPTNNGFYRYLAGLAYFYSAIVERNFKKVWDDALAKYDARAGSSQISSGFKMEDTDKMLSDILKPIEVKLFDDGLVSAFDKGQIEKIRESLKK